MTYTPIHYTRRMEVVFVCFENLFEWDPRYIIPQSKNILCIIHIFL